jgi:hypothetical protein
LVTWSNVTCGVVDCLPCSKEHVERFESPSKWNCKAQVIL